MPYLAWIACLYQLVLWVQGFVVSIPTILSGNLARIVSLGPCWATSLRMARMHAWSLAPHHPHRIHTGKRFWTLIISKIAETCRNGKCKSYQIVKSAIRTILRDTGYAPVCWIRNKDNGSWDPTRLCLWAANYSIWRLVFETSLGTAQ